MKEEIEKMDQAVADSSSFIKKMKDKDPQQIAFEKTISDFWDTLDVPQESLPVKIALYPSLESLNEEPKDELTETEHEYYDRKRKILVEKMAIANDVYLAHLQNYDQEDPKNKSQKFLFQFNEVGNKLHKQFNIVAERLRLPLEQPLMTYPSLGNLMDAIQQENIGDKNRQYFQEMAKEIKIKDDIAQKVLNNRLSVIKTPAEKGKTNLQYEEYQKESKKLLDFCEKMMGKREKEADSIELEQPEGVPKVKEISKEKLNEKLKEIIDQPQYVKPIGENTLPPYYSREMSRYEPPNSIKQKEREDLLEKVREMTSEESKGGKEEKSVEVDTDLSWDHEGLRPLPKAHKDRLNGSPKLPRVPKVPKAGGNTKGTFKKECPSVGADYKEGKYPESALTENKDGIVVPQEEKQISGMDKKNCKKGERWDFESPGNLVDKKTARWIEEQNEFLGKQEEKEFGSPKLPRVPKVPKAGGNTEGTFKKECPSFGADYKEGKYPESAVMENKDGIVVPQEEKQISGMDKKNCKKGERWDFESPGNLVDKKTARWIEEQNEFLGKQEEKEFEEDRKERDPPVFNPSGPVKVLQKQKANLHTGYEHTPQHLMGTQKGQALHPPLVMTNRGDLSWRGPGKRYPLKEKRRTQWGGYGRQYGRGGERKSNQTYRTDRTQTQGHNTAYESQRQGSYFPTKSTGNGQGGNGGDEDRNDKKKYRDTGIGFENDSHEESDTEDSYELEITPQQLSQVTPGGGALQIKLSRKKPLQITAGMPGRKSGTSMKPENIQSSKQPILSSHIDTFSENTQVKRRVEAPLLITPKH